MSAITLVLLVCGHAKAAPATQPDGNSTIKAPAGNSEIIITTTRAMAGAIDSLTWGGKEFIDRFDHGRELQTALAMDCGVRPFNSEIYNPTEAGSRDDGRKATTSSRLLAIHAAGATLETRSQMAFWLAPGERSRGQLAQNDRVLSDYILDKHVHIGHKNLPNAVEYNVTLEFPASDPHPMAQIEALTGYMPPEFDQFYTFDSATGRLEPIDRGPGEQAKPLVFATQGGSHAMGIYSPQRPSPAYGRFHFEDAHVEKWNCVFRLRDPHGVPAGKHSFRMFVAVGTMEDVRRTIDDLTKEFAEK